MSARSWKQWLPQAWRRAARDAWQAQRFRWAMRRLVALAPAGIPDRPLLAALRAGWGNDGFTADLDYLEEVARRAAMTAGPVLECGSGLTTLLLGALAGRRGVETWALEHDPRWHAILAAALRRHRIPGVRLCLAPLRDYGEFVWYDPPPDCMARTFRLVICDGPPESTRGGRFGLFPVLGGRFDAQTVILLDDAARASERATLHCWAHEAPLEIDVRNRAAGTYALITTGGD